MDKQRESPQASKEKGKRPLGSSLGATVRFVREKKSKEKEGVTKKPSYDDEEPSGVEVEEQATTSTRKRSPSWFATMFTKSQINSKPEKASSKSSVFPGNGNLLKKKARNTILSVLTKRQTQEKIFQAEKTDGRDPYSVMSSSEPSLLKASRTPEPMVVDVTSKPQRPTSVVVKSTSYQFTPSNQSRPSSDYYDRLASVKTLDVSEVPSRVTVDNIPVREAHCVVSEDVMDGTAVSRWRPQRRNSGGFSLGTNDPQSLGTRGSDAPRHLPSPLEEPSTQSSTTGTGIAPIVVSMPPSYTNKKDTTQNIPQSPDSVSEAVVISIPFQVHGQTQPAKSESRSDVWASSVSVSIPFQVKDNGEGVSVPPLSNSQSSTVSSSGGRNALATSNLARVSEPAKPTHVRLVSTETCDLLDSETSKSENSTAVEVVAPISPLPVLESTPPALLILEPGPDEPDGGAVTKPHTHSTPAAEKGMPPKDERSKAKKVTKETPKLMGKEASKHKTERPATVVEKLSPGMPGGKPRARSSFAAGEKLTTTHKQKSPSGTPSSLSPVGTPTDTPKSRSPASSPKLPKRNATPHNMNKSRSTTHGSPDQRKLANKGRPSSDPLIAEKLHAKRKAAGSNADHTAAAGKSKPDSEALRKKITELEEERKQLLEKIQAMEHQVAVIPLVEKEKLQLQKQLNEVTQQNDKQIIDLNALEQSSKKLSEDMLELRAKHDNLLVKLGSSKVELEELKEQNYALEKLKSTLSRENEQKSEAIDKHLDSIEKLTTANTTLVLQEGRLRNKISTLVNGLQMLKLSFVKLNEENKCLRSEIVEDGSELLGAMKNCVNVFGKVIVGVEEESRSNVTIETTDKDTQCNRLEAAAETVLEELKESKERVESLLNKINELQMEKVTHAEEKDNKDNEAVTEKDSFIESENLQAVPRKGEYKEIMSCPGCRDLQTKLESLRCKFESQKLCLQKSETERNEALEETKDLERETQYLKYVLSHREDMFGMQMSQQQNKEMEKMGANLVQAEKKVIDLEGEVDRLQAEKQTLLLSILKSLNCAQDMGDVKEEGEEEEDDTTESEESDTEAPANKQEEKNNEQVVKSLDPTSPGAPRTPDSLSRREQLKFRFQLSLSESDYSYSSERTEGEEDSESETNETDNELASKTAEQLKSVKMENKHLKSTITEAAEEKEELLASLDKLCEEFDSLRDRYDKLEDAHAHLAEKAKIDKRVFQSRVRDLETERANMRDSLRQIQDEKLVLLKCLETKNAEGPLESPLSETDVSEIISRAQSFVEKENKHSEPTSNEDESEDTSSSESEDEAHPPPPPPRKKVEGMKISGKRVSPEGQPETQTYHRSEDTELQSIVASIESDLGILKEKLKRKDNDVDGDVESGVETTAPKPPPGARILRRQASTVKSNLDRVSREKQHLENEVESLRRYLLKRRDSAMDVKRKPTIGSLKRAAGEVESHLDAIKTLQHLLQTSDNQLRQSNEVISRLESLNDDTEDKLRDAELLQDDLRRAVQIANNFALEEKEKSESLAKNNQDLIRQIELLKNRDGSVVENSPPKGRPKFELRKANSASNAASEDESLYADDESALTTEGESDFFSSRHSSIASESDFAQSPSPCLDNDLSDRSVSRNSNVASQGGSEEDLSKAGDTETECTSQRSSTVESSDTEDDNE